MRSVSLKELEDLADLTAVAAARLVDRLTVRERQVCELMAKGRPNQHVADALEISLRTVDDHRAAIKKKLGVKGDARVAAIWLLAQFHTTENHE